MSLGQRENEWENKRQSQTYLGKVMENPIVSTLYSNFSDATHSATSIKAGSSQYIHSLQETAHYEERRLGYILLSLGKVFVIGVPPVASLTCNLVSGFSLLFIPVFALGTIVGTGEDDVGMAFPSRRAFSRAAFSARSRLSASIWALMAALAFWSSSFSADTQKVGWMEE